MSRSLLPLAGCLFGFLLVLTSLAPVCEAQLKLTDNFNRADGSVRVGWSAWGNGAQISGNQLETFGELNVGGGIYRNFDVTFPLTFSFNFSTDEPTHAGWEIAFNSGAVAGQGPSDRSEFGVENAPGPSPVCVFFQTSSGPTQQCASVVPGQREYTSANALISGTVNADFSTKIMIRYNDGMTPATVTVKTPSPTGMLTTPKGSLLLLGNISETNGPHFFDNLALTLK